MYLPLSKSGTSSNHFRTISKIPKLPKIHSNPLLTLLIFGDQIGIAIGPFFVFSAKFCPRGNSMRGQRQAQPIGCKEQRASALVLRRVARDRGEAWRVWRTWPPGGSETEKLTPKMDGLNPKGSEESEQLQGLEVWKDGTRWDSIWD